MNNRWNLMLAVLIFGITAPVFSEEGSQLEINQSTVAQKDIDDLYNQGREFAKAGQYEKAIQQWTEVLKLDPHNEKASRSIQLAQELLKNGAASPSTQRQGSNETESNGKPEPWVADRSN